MNNLGIKPKIWFLLPSLGIIIFIILYFIATWYYPGGNQIDAYANGFSWIQNYWCNLLNTDAINGERNTAHSIAIFAMLILCLALGIFWYTFPQHVHLNKRNRLFIQIPGILSMLTCLFLFTGDHDVVINAASSLGLIAVAGVLVALWQLKWQTLFWIGMFNILPVVINNLLYYTPGYLFYLPLVQKITFAFFLVWICGVNYQLYRKIEVG